MIHATDISSARLILLLGPPRVGKTTVLQKVMCHSRYSFGGFFTVADDCLAGARTFRLITVHRRQRDVPELNRVLIKPCEIHDVATFSFEDLETRGVAALLRAAATCDVVVVDELGAIQLHSKIFRQTFQNLVDSSVIVIATGTDAGSSFIEELSRRVDCLVSHVSMENRSSLAHDIHQQLRRLLASKQMINACCETPDVSLRR